MKGMVVKVREIIYKHIENQLKNEREILEENTFTANEISKLFNIKRNTASRYLNELFREGHLVKINSRPVLFTDRKFVEQVLGEQILNNEFSSISELVNKDTIFFYRHISWLFANSPQSSRIGFIDLL